MKRFSLDHIGHQFTKKLQSLRSQRLFHDRISIGLIFASLVLIVLAWVVLLSRVRPTDFPVPVRYSSLTGFDVLGPWYQTLQLGVFASLVMLVNLALSIRCFPRSRITSFFLLSSSLVIGLFCLIISAAFTAVL